MRNYLRQVDLGTTALGAIVGLIGMVLLGACLYLSHASFNVLVHGHQTNGIVHEDACRKASCTATITFTGMDGKDHEKATALSNLPGRSNVVRAVFHQRPGHAPENVSIGTIDMMWIGPLVTALFGSISSFVGLCLVAQSLPERRSASEAPAVKR